MKSIQLIDDEYNEQRYESLTEDEKIIENIELANGIITPPMSPEHFFLNESIDILGCAIGLPNHITQQISDELANR
jgi:hypothetical protein